MILQVFLFIFLLLIIFFVAKNVANQKFSLIEKVFKNRKLSIWILSLIFLPGTVIHELSHFLIALILRVPTGPISIFPQINPTPNGSDKSHPSGEYDKLTIRTGHIMVARTDPVRLTLIGVAPMIIGLIIIYFLGNAFVNSFTSGESLYSGHPRGEIMQATITQFFLIYLLFITSTTMFSSRQDLKSLIITLPFTFIIAAALYFSGIKIILDENLIEKTGYILSNLNRSLIITVGFDYMVLLILAGLGSLDRRGLPGIRG